MKKTFILMALAVFSTITLKAQNPISPMGVYIADPSSRVDDDGRLYIYGSLDETTEHYCSDKYHVLSSNDLINWTLHENSFTWSDILYAPDMMKRGDTYYLYFDVPKGDEYVAESKSPTGPFVNSVQIEGPKQIDPNIFIDDGGQAYFFWGQFFGKGAMMNPNMKTLDLSTMKDSIVTWKVHNFHEGSYVVKRGKYYYYIYADTSRKRPTALGYAMATSPLGPYEYKGVIIDNNGCDSKNWNNHGSIVEYKGQWYVLYHRSTHASNTMRKACIEPIYFNEDGTINEVEMTSQGAGGPLDAFKRTYGAMACKMGGNVRIRRTEYDAFHEELGAIQNGDWALWRYLDFGSGAQQVELQINASSAGKLILLADSLEGSRLGEIEVHAQEGWQTVSMPVDKVDGKHALYMKFESDSQEPFLNIDWFQFRAF